MLLGIILGSQALLREDIESKNMLKLSMYRRANYGT